MANPVLTCATATEAGYPSNFVADPFLYLEVRRCCSFPGSLTEPVMLPHSRIQHPCKGDCEGLNFDFWMLRGDKLLKHIILLADCLSTIVLTVSY